MAKAKHPTVSLSEAAILVGLTRQTLWEWAKKGWIQPLKSASKTGGRPAQLFNAEEIIKAAEERLLLTPEQAATARKKLSEIDKGDKGDNNDATSKR